MGAVEKSVACQRAATSIEKSPALPGGVTANNWNVTNAYDAFGNRDPDGRDCESTWL